MVFGAPGVVERRHGRVAFRVGIVRAERKRNTQPGWRSESGDHVCRLLKAVAGRISGGCSSRLYGLLQRMRHDVPRVSSPSYCARRWLLHVPTAENAVGAEETRFPYRPSLLAVFVFWDVLRGLGRGLSGPGFLHRKIAQRNILLAIYLVIHVEGNLLCLSSCHV